MVAVKSFLGLGICALSSLLMCTANSLTKQLASVNPVTLSSLRFLYILVLSTPISLTIKEHPFPKGKRWMLVIRGVLGATNNILKNYALQVLPLADTTMVSATAPMFTVFFARIFLKEPIVCIDILNVFIIISGMVLIVKPPFLFGSYIEASDIDSNGSTQLAIVALVLSSIFIQPNVYVTLRLLKDVHWATVCTTAGCLGFIGSTLVTVLLGATCLSESALDRACIVMIGVLSFLGQVALVSLAKFENAGTSALMRKSCDVLLAFLFQMLIFKEMPDLLKVIGTLLISLAIITSSLKKVPLKWLKNQE